MALARRLLEQDLSLREVDRHPFAQPISLAEIERGIGVALGGERTPCGNRGGVIALLPRLDPGAHARTGGRRRDQQAGGQRHSKQCAKFCHACPLAASVAMQPSQSSPPPTRSVRN